MFDDLSAARKILQRPVAELFHQACAVAGRDIPKSVTERKQFADDCVSAAKVKAELLAKVMPEPIQHSNALKLVVNLLFFQNWHDFVSFAKRFHEIPEDQLLNFRETYCLAAALWTLKDGDRDEPIVTAMCTFQNELLSSLSADLRGELLSRVMWKRESSSWLKEHGRAQDNYGLSEEEVLYALKDFLGILPERLLVAILDCRPLEDGRRVSWPSLESVTVSTMLAQPLALKDADAGFGLPGWGHGVAYILSELDSYAALSPPASGGLFLDNDRNIRAEQAAISRKARAESTRLTSKAALYSMLKPLMRTTVLQALTRKEGRSGFFNEFYEGSPESVERKLIEVYEMHEATVKRLVFREMVGSHQLTIFRWRMPTEDTGHRLYEVEAVLHNVNDELVAKVGLALYYNDEWPTAYDLAWALDEHDDDDLREVGIGIAQIVSRGEVSEDELGRVMVIRDWEVRASDRGHGLGPSLLSAAVGFATRGLPNVRVAALRLDPLKHRVPPMDDWSPSDYPELFKARADLYRCWSKVSGPDSIFARKGIQIVKTSYIPACHGSHHMQLMAMSQVGRETGFD